MPEDTTPEAAAVQREVLRLAGPVGRVELAFQISEELRAVTLAGLRARNPEKSGAEIRSLLLRRILGERLFAEAWPEGLSD